MWSYQKNKPSTYHGEHLWTKTELVEMNSQSDLKIVKEMCKEKTQICTHTNKEKALFIMANDDAKLPQASTYFNFFIFLFRIKGVSSMIEMLTKQINSW